MAVTNADLGISESNAFADTPVETQQTAKTSKPSTRMQSAASSGVAPPVTAPTAVASQPEQPVLPPVPTASAAAPANIQNPAQSGDFWKSAFTSALPSVIGGLGLAAGGYLAGRGQRGGGGGGAVPPPVDEEMRQIKLAQEQAKHEAIIAENYRKQEAHDARLANEAKRAEANLQKMQGKASSPTSADQQATELIKKSEENKVSKAVVEASKPKPVAPPPTPPVVTAPTVTAPAPTAPVTPPVTTPKPSVDTTGLTKEQAGMKKYLTSFYGGGPLGEQAYEKTIEILGSRPEYEKGKGGGLSAQQNDTIKAWRKENIEGPKVNLTKEMKNAMKGASGVAVLAAIPGFAEAAQRKDYGKMTDLATDFFVLPFAQSSEAGMPKKQEESIIAQKFKEAQKLGSPYRSVPPPR